MFRALIAHLQEALHKQQLVFDVIVTVHRKIRQGEGPTARGGAVVESLRYKPEGRGIDSR
jgi:hypothetical protein